MKMLVLLAAAGLCALLVASGSVHFYISRSPALGGGPSPVVQDVLALQDATATTNVGDARAGVLSLIHRAAAMNAGAAALVLRRRLQFRANRAAAEFARGRQALAAVPVQTPPGSTCREAALRLAARSETLYRTLAAEIASTRATWQAVKHFRAGSGAAMRSYITEARECLAEVPPADRGPVARLMSAL
jgi:hypothetical protein